MDEPSTRRHFLRQGAKSVGLLLGIGVVAVGGAGAVFPRASGSVQFAEGRCGGRSRPAVLIAYASEFGSTGEVANRIGTVLCDRGFAVEVKRIPDAVESATFDLASFDAVVVGGPIQYDKWMSEARDFVAENAGALAVQPVAYFFTCLTLAERTVEAEEKALGYASELETLSALRPRGVGKFGGVLDYSRMSWATAAAWRAISLIPRLEACDYRDWQRIEAWARHIDLS